jgi:DNA-directed RNA polymerase specialized sigma subunit
MSVPLGKTRDSKDDQQMSGNEDDFIYNLTGSSFSGDMDEERSMLGGKGDYAKITTIVKKVFDTLPEREKQVLMLRYENQEMMENQHNE